MAAAALAEFARVSLLDFDALVERARRHADIGQEAYLVVQSHRSEGFPEGRVYCDSERAVRLTPHFHESCERVLAVVRPDGRTERTEHAPAPRMVANRHGSQIEISRFGHPDVTVSVGCFDAVEAWFYGEEEMGAEGWQAQAWRIYRDELAKAVAA